MSDFFKCNECVDLLLDYLEGSLDGRTRQQLDEHMAACPPCVNFLKTYQTCCDMTRSLKERRASVPRELEERLKSFLHEHL